MQPPTPPPPLGIMSYYDLFMNMEDDFRMEVGGWEWEEGGFRVIEDLPGGLGFRKESGEHAHMSVRVYSAGQAGFGR